MLTAAIEDWGSIYANHAVLRTAIEFLHVAGLMVAGGCAIAADRITWRAARIRGTAAIGDLRALRGTHRVVVAGLAVVVISGLLMFAADLDTLLYSKVFWIKMALLILLIVNGSVLLKAEHRIEAGDEHAWSALSRSATASAALWTLTTLAGSALLNAG